MSTTVIAQIISTLIAFIALIWTVASQNREVRKQEERIKREQARKVSAWNSFDPRNESDGMKGNAIFYNSSEEPIYNVFEFVHVNNATNPIDDYFFKDFEYRKYIEVFPPKHKSSLSYVDSHAMGNEHCVPALFFTDSNNIEWYRHANGYLEQKRYVKLFEKKGLLMKHV